MVSAWIIFPLLLNHCQLGARYGQLRGYLGPVTQSANKTSGWNPVGTTIWSPGYRRSDENLSPSNGPLTDLLETTVPSARSTKAWRMSARGLPLPAIFK